MSKDSISQTQSPDSPNGIAFPIIPPHDLPPGYVDQVLEAGKQLYDLGYWVIPIRARGERYKKVIGGKSTLTYAKGKEPFGMGWGANRWTWGDIERSIRQIPGRGYGLCMGPGRGPGGAWPMDFEGDGPEAESSWLTLCQGEDLATLGWMARRGAHRLVTGDGERLIGLFVRSGAVPKKGEPGVFHHPRLPGLEARIGGTNPKGAIKQIQSVGAPCLGEDGKPRVWFPCRDLAELPERSYLWLEELAREHYGSKALAAEAATVASKGPGERHDAMRDACMRLASLYKGGSITEPQALKELMDSAEANGLVAEGRGEEVVELWESALPKVDARRIPGFTSTPSSNGKHQASTPGDSPIVNKSEQWLSCQHNSKIWLSRGGLAAKIRYDRFRRKVFVDGKSIDDAIVTRLTGELEKDIRRPWSQDHLRSAIVDIGYSNEYSSLTDWLDSLKWDQTYRLNTFFNEGYGIPYTRYAGECARVLFLSAVARAYQPGCQADVMPVLIADQGLYKSTGLAALCPFEDWFAEDLGGDLVDRKATGEGLQGKWIVEFSEFTRINRATLDVVKGFVSRRVDHYRPSYGRIAQDFPRSCIFVGTTNDQHPLQDIQNRRFMTLHVAQGDVAWIRANRDQLWAEAIVRYRDGEPWWVTDPDRVKECVEEQENARQIDSWQEILDERLTGWEKITMSEAANFLDIKAGQLERRHETRIGIALHALGFTRKRVRDGKKLKWIYERFLPEE